MTYFNPELYEEASRAYKNADYYKALFIYEGAYKELSNVMKMAQYDVDFIDTKTYLESRITAILISFLAQTPIENNNILSTLSDGWKKTREWMIRVRKNAAILEAYQKRLTTPENLEDTWITLIEKCDEISDNLYQLYLDEKSPSFKMPPFLNEAYEWKLRVIDLSNRFNRPIALEIHLDLLNLQVSQLRLTQKKASIVENMHNHIVAYDLLNIMKKINKLELFFYYLSSTPNIGATELTDIKTQGEIIISGLKKPGIITTAFRKEITTLEKKQNLVLASKSNENLASNPISEHKSILKKPESNLNAPRKKISFSFFPAIKWVEKDSRTTYNSLFTRFIVMIKNLSREYGSNEFSTMFLSLCGDFFIKTTFTPCQYSIEDSFMFSIIKEIYTAAHNCRSLPENECQALLITSVTSALIALKPFFTATNHEEMVDALFNNLINAIKNTSSLVKDSEGIISLMNDVFNGNKISDFEEEITHSLGYA